MNPQFPSPFSPQRLTVATPTAANYKKTPLRPGHSLMDWIRLTKSGADLRGVGPGLKQISEEELAKHNKTNDAWMAIRGFVYNVTNYMDYHPGGASELMRGAGKDATTLFDEIHRWVNFESMLKACLIGKLVTGKTLNESSTSSSSSNFLAPPPVAPVKSLSKSLKKSSRKISSEWNQNDDTITIVANTSVILNTDDVVCDVKDKCLLATIFLSENDVAMLSVKFSIEIAFKSVGISDKNHSVNIVLSKINKKMECKSIEYLNDHCKIINRKELKLYYRLCSLVKKTIVTHDTALYQFHLPPSCYMHVPIGSHIYLQADVDGISITRPYTVVIPTITKQVQNTDQEPSDIHLMIKVYEHGALTPVISNLKIGDKMFLSTYEGSFKLSTLKDYQCLVLFCGGTGFTPMIRLIYHFLFECNKKVVLVFFNKKCADILWKMQLDQLQIEFKNQFHVCYVLSEPDNDWTGGTGHISTKLISDAYDLASCNSYTCVCGPPIFTRLAVSLLQQQKSKSDFHVFTK